MTGHTTLLVIEGTATLGVGVSWRGKLRALSEGPEIGDDRVDLFATSLAQGLHTVTYLARATTPGRFYAAPTTAEAMYESEIAGRGAGVAITVTPTP